MTKLMACYRWHLCVSRWHPDGQFLLCIHAGHLGSEDSINRRAPEYDLFIRGDIRFNHTWGLALHMVHGYDRNPLDIEPVLRQPPVWKLPRDTIQEVIRIYSVSPRRTQCFGTAIEHHSGLHFIAFDTAVDVFTPYPRQHPHFQHYSFRLDRENSQIVGKNLWRPEKPDIIVAGMDIQHEFRGGGILYDGDGEMDLRDLHLDGDEPVISGVRLIPRSQSIDWVDAIDWSPEALTLGEEIQRLHEATMREIRSRTC